MSQNITHEYNVQVGNSLAISGAHLERLLLIIFFMYRTRDTFLESVQQYHSGIKNIGVFHSKIIMDVSIKNKKCFILCIHFFLRDQH